MSKSSYEVAYLALFFIFSSGVTDTKVVDGGETISQPSEVAKSITFDSPEAKSPAGTDAFLLQPGFRVERLFTVPKDTLGSWVAITFDDKGRLIASDQGNFGLCRITPPKLGSSEPTKVERLDAKISSAQGLLFAFGSLYVSVNGGQGSGLYRVRDTNGDDQFDEVVKLKELRGAGEHGPHGLRLSADGKSILVIGGNHTQPPFDVQRNGEPQTMGGVRTAPLRVTLPENAASRVAANWDEDSLLPRQWDGNGHATGILAPGGWVAKTDPDGKTWEIVSVGYRNSYDMDLNADGELFVYDSDMEWDFGMPWYRPTRVTHATDGSDFGWRSGTINPPAHYIDSLPPMIDIGPGSPVGVAFGYGTRFPAKYQKALYICDWTFGTMYALHLTPNGSTYRAAKEEFVARTPLPLTDVAPGPDGALYFTVGGRGTQSELFRVTYVGAESTAPVDFHETAGADARAARRQIENYQHRADDQAQAIEFVWPYLANSDRFIRFAAMTALEHQETKFWKQRVIAEKDTQALLTSAVALARQGDAADQPELLAALERVNFASLPVEQKLDLLRVWQLAFIRLGSPPADVFARLEQKLAAFYPAEDASLNRELCTVLVFLQSPTVVAKTVSLMKQPSADADDFGKDVAARNAGYGGTIQRMHANRPETQKMHYAYVLRNAKTGWRAEDRAFYFQWLQDAQGKSGGASYRNFLKNIDADAFVNVPEVERLALSASGLRKAFSGPELPKPLGPGHDWTLEELRGLESKLQRRDFANGRRAFAAARCVVCHRFAGEGGATGPDLTQLAGRFNLKDLSEAIVDPSKVISDQYRGVVVKTSEGQTYTGRIVAEAGDSVTMLVDPEDPSKLVTIKKQNIDANVPAPQSLMPKDSLKPLNEDEVLDMLAYLLSRGNERSRMFRPSRAPRGR